MSEFSRFNIEQVREVNKLKIMSKDIKTGFVTRVFEAYLPTGFNISTSLQTDNMFGGITDMLARSFPGLIKAANLLGVTNFTGNIDIRKYMFYKGSNSLQFNVNSFLILKEDYDRDILLPLRSLMDFYLPSRGDAIEDLGKTIKGSLNKSEDVWKKNETMAGKAASKMFELLNEGYDAVRNFIGPVYNVQVPTQFGRTKEGQVNNFIYFGDHFWFEDCYISSVNLGIPLFLVEGGRPDVIDVSITIETARNAMQEMFHFDNSVSDQDVVKWQFDLL